MKGVLGCLGPRQFWASRECGGLECMGSQGSRMSNFNIYQYTIFS